MSPTDLVGYYQNLLIVQWKAAAKAVATVGAVCTEVVAGLIYNDVQAAYNLATAVGVQLDVLGAYVGIRRRIAGFIPGSTFFSYPNYSDGGSGFGGFADYSDVAAPMDFFKDYTSIETAYILSDGQMSQLIAYLIAVHASDHTNASIDAILASFFNGYCSLTDNGDMTITYTHQTADPSLLFALVNYLGLLPKPAGVGVIVVEV